MLVRISLLPLLLISFLFVRPAVTPVEEVQECAFSEEIPVVKDYMRLLAISDPFQGNYDADVTVIEYFDPNCPHCKTLHPIMKEVIAANGKRARFYMIPFVLWQYSLPQAEALFVAGQDGKYFEMLEAQYAQQKPGGLSFDELIAIAAGIGLDPVVFKGRLEKGLNQKMILERRQEISSLGVRGTPAVMINGKFVDSGSKSLNCINQLIAAEAASLKQG
jgi:protein-disulfide isomerase